MRRNSAHDTAAFCLGLLLIGALVQAAGSIKGDALVFPGVPEILRAFIRLIASGHTWRLVATTLGHLLLSLAASALIGTAIGALEGVSDFARGLLKPLMILLRAMPMIVLVVIVMVLWDYSEVPVIAAVLILVPVISEAVCEGIRGIDRELNDVWRLSSGLNPRVLMNVHLPLIAGYMKQAFFNAAGMGLKLAVTTEYLVQTKNSLGKAVYTSGYFNEYAEIYAYALIMILLVSLVSGVPAWIGKIRNNIKTR